MSASNLEHPCHRSRDELIRARNIDHGLKRDAVRECDTQAIALVVARAEWGGTPVLLECLNDERTTVKRRHGSTE
jgi:hypothetical protein